MMFVAQSESMDAEQLKDLVLQLIKNVRDCTVSGDYSGFVILGFLLSAVIVGSGAFASSIAESRIRGRDFHFFLGMLIPVVYPIIILVSLPRKEFKKEEVKTMDQIKEFTEEKSGEFDLSSSLNYDFFQGAMFDETGNPRGPFIMSVDNVELRVERIAEVLPKIVVLETVNSDGKQQTMRLPFSRISSCHEI